MDTEPADNGLSPICHDEPYPRYEPGIYEVACYKATVYRDPRFGCWKCRLDCELFGEGGKVAGFLNLGTGDEPHAGRCSEFRRVWTMANGTQPKKRQTLSCRVFRGKLFRVRIADTETRYDGRPHLAVERYSTIKEFLERTGP